MAYIITTRNPSNKRLVIITYSDTRDNERVAEYKTERAARKVADNQVVCKAWGYEIVEVLI